MGMINDDNELARRAVDGDRGAFQLLLERHYDLLYRVAYRYLGNQADAEDVTHDICMALAGKLRTFRGNSRLTTWLYRVAVNACRDFARKHASQRSLHERYTEMAALTRAAEAEAKDRSRWIHDALASLDQSLRETAILVLSEGLSHTEAGQALGVKAPTVSWRMHEVRKKLKILADAEND